MELLLDNESLVVFFIFFVFLFGFLYGQSKVGASKLFAITISILVTVFVAVIYYFLINAVSGLNYQY